MSSLIFQVKNFSETLDIVPSQNYDSFAENLPKKIVVSQ